MMPRVFLVWLLLASTMGWLVYQMKYDVQAREEKLNRINREIVEEQETTRILTAEWAYLTQPRQIDQASRLLSGLAPVKNIQIVDISRIPMRGQLQYAPAPAAPVAAPKVAPPVDLDTEGPSEGVPDDADPAPGTSTDRTAVDPKTLLMVARRAVNEH